MVVAELVISEDKFYIQNTIMRQTKQFTLDAPITKLFQNLMTGDTAISYRWGYQPVSSTLTEMKPRIEHNNKCYVAETDSAASEKIAKPSGLNLRQQYLCSSLMRRTKTDPGFKRYGSMEYSERIAVTWQFEQCFQQTE